jgi:AcrR family transcriptional regulator
MKKVTKTAKLKALPGRPRAFDPDATLDRALRVFWEKGYEGASLSDLTKAMRINRPSLYSAYGNKEALFLKALDRYCEGPGAFLKEALTETTARAVVERLLRQSAQLLTDKRNPSGCLMVQGALACGDEGERVRKELTSRRGESEALLYDRFKRARFEGELPAESDPADLARYVITVLHGMSVQAAGGANRGDLQRVVDLALRAFPD